MNKKGYVNIMIKLVRELEEYRLKNRLPQEELARSLDVAFSTVNRWINGKTVPNKTQRYHIEKLLFKKRGVNQHVD